MSNTNKLIFDIETVGVDFNSLDKISQEYVREYAETEEDLIEATGRLSFSPLTGTIAAIGLINPDTRRGNILLATSKQLPEELQPGIQLESGTEAEIIEKFWSAASHYNTFVTFNGRVFDAPFILVRSAIHGVKPTKNLMSNRYLASQLDNCNHVDLLDQLTYYGAVRKKYNLHFWCKAFGIPSPKESGLSGKDVERLVREGRWLEMAQYNLGDLLSTMQLYEKWNRYLNL
ncbi:MAG: ribonuclease H-like domain-containing protein [Candidatus Liptonbacteria bacterium]|nr:ribonuclease H-like domain-containing protein [Candidatus Liptonbacteria bacterium]